MRKVMAVIISVSLLFCCLLSFPIFSQAAELSGYQNETLVRFRNAYSGKYLTVHSSVVSGVSNVIQSNYNSTSVAQVFKLTYIPEDDVYEIGAATSFNESASYNRVLNVALLSGRVQNGCNVEVKAESSANDPQWIIEYVKEGKFTIVPRYNMLVGLSVSDTSNGSSETWPGAAGNVNLTNLPRATGLPFDPDDRQLWYIEEVTPKRTVNDGFYRIQSNLLGGEGGTWHELSYTIHTEEIEDENGDFHLIRDVTQGGDIRDPAQVWELTYLFNGYYLITPCSACDVSLAARSDTDETGHTVHVAATNTASKYVQWKIIPNVQYGETVGYRIVSKASHDNQVLTVLYGNEEIGADIGLVPYVDGFSQHWVLSPVTSCFGTQGETIGSGPTATYRYFSAGHFVGRRTTTTGEDQFYCRHQNCVATFTAPEFEDAEVLAPEHYATMLALKRAFGVKYAEGNFEEADALRRIMDDIRGWTAFRNPGKKYSFGDQSGTYLPVRPYGFETSEYDFSISVNRITLSQNELQNDVLLLKALSMIPGPYGMFCSMTAALTESVLENDTSIVFSEALDIAYTVETDMLIETFELVSETAFSSTTFGKIYNAVSTIRDIGDSIENLQLALAPSPAINMMYDLEICFTTTEENHVFRARYAFDDPDDVEIRFEKLLYGSTPTSDANYGKYSYTDYTEADPDQFFGYDYWIPFGGIVYVH